LKKHIYFIFIYSIAITGCSNKELYKNLQSHDKNRCINKSTSNVQYAECMKQPYKPYEEYEKERKDLIEEK